MPKIKGHRLVLNPADGPFGKLYVRKVSSGAANARHNNNAALNEVQHGVDQGMLITVYDIGVFHARAVDWGRTLNVSEQAARLCFCQLSFQA